MAVLKAFTKAAIEKKKYTLDYSCWLDEGEELTDFAIAIGPMTTPPLTAYNAIADVDKVRLSTFFTGGKVGQTYIIAFVVTTSLTQVKRDDLHMRIT